MIVEVADGGGCTGMAGYEDGWICICIGMMVPGSNGPKLCMAPSSEPSFFDLPPLFLGRFVPGGASRLTVQYDPNPGSEGGRGCRSNRRFRER